MILLPRACKIQYRDTLPPTAHRLPAVRLLRSSLRHHRRTQTPKCAFCEKAITSRCMILEIDGKKVRLHQGKCTVGCVDEHLLRRRRQPTLIEGHASAYKTASPNQSYQTTGRAWPQLITMTMALSLVSTVTHRSGMRDFLDKPLLTQSVGQTTRVCVSRAGTRSR